MSIVSVPAGVRPSLLLCFALHTVCRLAMALTRSRTVLLLVLLGPETMAGSLGVPVLTIGIKRFTNQASRPIDASPTKSYLLWYRFWCPEAYEMVRGSTRSGQRHGAYGSLLNACIKSYSLGLHLCIVN